MVRLLRAALVAGCAGVVAIAQVPTADAGGAGVVRKLLKKFEPGAGGDAADAARRAADPAQAPPGGTQLRRINPNPNAASNSGASNLPPPPPPVTALPSGNAGGAGGVNLPPPPGGNFDTRAVDNLLPTPPVDDLGAVRRAGQGGANDGTVYVGPETLPGDLRGVAAGGAAASGAGGAAAGGLGGAAAALNRALPPTPRPQYDVVPPTRGAIFYERFPPLTAAARAPDLPPRPQQFASPDTVPGLQSNVRSQYVQLPDAPVRIDWPPSPRDIQRVRVEPPPGRLATAAKVTGGLITLGVIGGGVAVGYIYREPLEDSTRQTFNLEPRDPDDPTPESTIVVDASGTITKAGAGGSIPIPDGTTADQEPEVSDRDQRGRLPKTVRVVVQNTLEVPLEVAFVAKDGTNPLIELMNPGLARPIHMPGGAALALRANNAGPNVPYTVFAPEHAVTVLRAGWVLKP